MMMHRFAAVAALAATASVTLAEQIDVNLGFDGLGLSQLELLDDQLVDSHKIDFNGTARIWDATGDPEAQVTRFVLQSAAMSFSAADGYGFSNLTYQLEVRFFQTITIEVYDVDGGLIGTEQRQGTQFGFQIFDIDLSSYGEIGSVHMHDSGQSFRVDNLAYTARLIPLPTAALSAMGVFGLAGIRRARRA